MWIDGPYGIPHRWPRIADTYGVRNTHIATWTSQPGAGDGRVRIHVKPSMIEPLERPCDGYRAGTPFTVTVLRLSHSHFARSILPL
jgi:hypothetical protein